MRRQIETPGKIAVLYKTMDAGQSTVISSKKSKKKESKKKEKE